MNQFIHLFQNWKAKRSATHEEAYSKAKNPRAVEFSDLNEIFHEAMRDNFFVKASALYDVVKGVTALGYKADAVRMIQDLGSYLSQKSALALSEPQLVELQRTFIWTHAEVIGFAPKREVEALYVEATVPQDVRDILAAAVAKHGSAPRERFKQLIAETNAMLVDAGFAPVVRNMENVPTRTPKQGDLIHTSKGFVVLGKDMGAKIKQLSPEEQAARRAEKKREAALRRVNAKASKANRKAAKAAEAAAEAAKNKSKRK